MDELEEWHLKVLNLCEIRNLFKSLKIHSQLWVCIIIEPITHEK